MDPAATVPPLALLLVSLAAGADTQPAQPAAATAHSDSAQASRTAAARARAARKLEFEVARGGAPPPPMPGCHPHFAHRFVDVCFEGDAAGLHCLEEKHGYCVCMWSSPRIRPCMGACFGLLTRSICVPSTAVSSGTAHCSTPARTRRKAWRCLAASPAPNSTDVDSASPTEALRRCEEQGLPLCTCMAMNAGFQVCMGACWATWWTVLAASTCASTHHEGRYVRTMMEADSLEKQQRLAVLAAEDGSTASTERKLKIALAQRQIDRLLQQQQQQQQAKAAPTAAGGSSRDAPKGPSAASPQPPQPPQPPLADEARSAEQQPPEPAPGKVVCPANKAADRAAACVAASVETISCLLSGKLICECMHHDATVTECFGATCWETWWRDKAPLACASEGASGAQARGHAASAGDAGPSVPASTGGPAASGHAAQSQRPSSGGAPPGGTGGCTHVLQACIKVDMAVAACLEAGAGNCVCVNASPMLPACLGNCWAEIHEAACSSTK